MQRTSDNQKLASTAHRAVQKSTTLNRRYVKRPAPMAKKISVLDDAEPVEPVITSENLEDAIQEAKDIEQVEKYPTISKFAPEERHEKKISVLSSSEDEAPKVNSHEAKSIKIEKFDTSEAKAVEPETKKIKTQIKTPINTPKVVDLPPAPNPYQAAIDARTDALEVKKAAGKSAKFYVGPTAEERKNAEIEKALKEVSQVEKPTVAQKEISPKKAAAIAKKAERAARKTSVESERVALKAQRQTAKAERLSLAKKAAADRKALKIARQEKMAKVARQAKLAKEAEKDSVLSRNVKTTDMSLKRASARRGGRGKRMVLALSCSVACVVALGALVYKNIPDISVKVTAMQSGIEASYPSYIPRDFALSGVSVDDEGAVVMEFKGPDVARFTVSEKESSWDSSALLNNFVKKNWSEDGYVAARENGITIYICESNAVWVNGGILYKITAPSGTLTKKQIKNIVTSI